MNLAKVLGRVVASRKEESIEGLKLLMLGAAGPDGKMTGATVVAVDAVGAGEGEFVHVPDQAEANVPGGAGFNRAPQPGGCRCFAPGPHGLPAFQRP